MIMIWKELSINVSFLQIIIQLASSFRQTTKQKWYKLEGGMSKVVIKTNLREEGNWGEEMDGSGNREKQFAGSWKNTILQSNQIAVIVYDLLVISNSQIEVEMELRSAAARRRGDTTSPWAGILFRCVVELMSPILLKYRFFSSLSSSSFQFKLCAFSLSCSIFFFFVN